MLIPIFLAPCYQVRVSNFFKEVPAILKRFWLMLLASSTVIAGVAIMMTNVVPVGYQIKAFNAILPLGVVMSSHILLPMVLNRKLAHLSPHNINNVPFTSRELRFDLIWLSVTQLGSCISVSQQVF